MAIASLFCFGQLLSPFSVYKGIKARKQIQLDPTISGERRAVAAIVIGAIGFCGWLIASFLLVVADRS